MLEESIINSGRLVADAIDRLARTQDRVADALEALLSQRSAAVTTARVDALERKTEALAEAAPDPVPTPTPTPRAKKDPAPEPPPEVPHETEPEEPAAPAKLTVDDIRALGKQIIQRDGQKPAAFKAVLKAMGVGNASELKPDQLEECAAKLRTELGV